MKKLFFFTFLIVLFLINSCTENVVNNISGFNRTLVIISDDTPETELIMGILGSVRNTYPDVEIKFFKNKNFDLFEAGYLLEVAANSFPENTCFAVIVDPGVSAKKTVYSFGKRKVLSPDNGISTKMRIAMPPQEMHYVDNMSIFGSQFNNYEEVPYQKFYRDAILHMLSDANISTFGSVCSEPVNLNIVQPSLQNGVIQGQILFTDNFGNCETNIKSDFINQLNRGDILEVSSDDIKFYAKYGLNYSSVDVNENVVFFNSKSRLEISVNFGNMSERYSLNAGNVVNIKKADLKVGILRFNSSELVNNIITGAKSELAAKGFIENKNIEYFEKNAEGDISKFPSLIGELLSAGIDIIIPVSTPASQAALQFVPENIPVVYTYVTSPEFAGLINKRSNVTGLSDATNFDDYLKFAKELLPNMKTAGRIFNPGEPNSAFSQNQFLALGNFYGINYINESINSVEQISEAYQRIESQNPDAILIAADNTLNLGFKSLAEMAAASKIPLIGDSEENSDDGALASISVDYGLLSKTTGKIVGSVILGMPADSKPIQRFPTSSITLNQITAGKIGFTFSSSIINSASKIIQ
ncbi:MAG: SAM-dependent chlorinase/fluorinase [Candidatus Kapabacteria bacterium]|nr:SAM-dependent chlorinase/fluorinase [Ignavibacteriota bacterium]MCW5884204.1 SAM-dependent chlorinase/fluorinase [Candidatus Kapabacteria bacterium]